MKNRIWHLDLVRVFSVLWIVAIWHNHIISGNIFYSITIGVLGSFTYLSGLLLGRKNTDFKNINSSLTFYWNRIKRLYPFFFLSAILFYILPINYITSLKKFIYTITFVSPFVNNMPGTIWYVCMIFIFYFITPVILLSKKPIYKISVSIIMFSVFFVLSYFHHCDIRLCYYFPVYAFGLIYGSIRGKNPKILLLMFLFSLVSVLLFIFLENKYLHILLAVSIALFVEYLCRFIDYEKINIKFINSVSYISYASMLIYLFHRQYNFICDNLMNFIYHGHYVILKILLLPIFIFCCYEIQKIYDNLLRKKNETKYIFRLYKRHILYFGNFVSLYFAL